MSRAIAKRFNHHFGDTFKEPQELIQNNVAVVPGIDGRKMSKSYNNGIDPLSPAKNVKKQVMAIVTDSKGLEEPKDPDTCNIVSLFKLFANEAELNELKAKYRAGNFGYGHAKLALLEKIEQKFAAPRAKFEELINNKTQLDAFLSAGAEQARQKAKEVLLRARKACGLS